MTIKLSALTTPELEASLQVFAQIETAYELLLETGALDPDEEYGIGDVVAAICDELIQRAQEDTSFHINQAVERGDVARYMRPDGQSGYAAPDAWDEGDV